MRTSSLVTTAPLAIAVAVVTVAVVVRVQRPGLPPPGTATVTVTSSDAGSASAASSGLDAALRAPPGGAVDAAVVRGGPRMLHGGPRRTHRSAGRGPGRAEPRWRANVGGAVSAQVVTSPDEQTLYVATHAGSLLALSRADGTTRWQVALGERVYSTPLVLDDGTIFVGSDGKKLASITKDGVVSWRLEVEGEIDGGPVLGKDGNVVFAAGPNVYAVRRGGDLAWRFATKGKVYTSPAVADDGTIVFGAQDDRVRALTPAGALAWEVDLGSDVDGSPAITDDGRVVVGTDKGEVVCLDGKGALQWRTPVGGFVRGALSVARNGDVLAGTYGPVPRMVRLAPDGAIRGAFAIHGTGAREFGIHGGALEDADGALYFGGQDDVVRAIGPDGAERWRFTMGADVDAPVTMLDDGSLVIASEDGTITMLLP
ncbi:MAG: PQQ-binding-like beta-propeller repeat protein [Deltaproteobacteria bacterium]|nr:PQQ-binding-like beta-propeller repeat protein [Deltaproteobacteria bacterium]